MNRYDWLSWGFKLLIGSKNITEINKMITDLMNVDMTGEQKRESIVSKYVETVKADLPNALQAGATYLLRSLVELLLAQSMVKGIVSNSEDR